MPNKIMLDGTSFESVVGSFANLWGIDAKVVIAAIYTTDIYKIWHDAEVKESGQGDNAVIRTLRKKLKINSSVNFDGMKWFHAARVPKHTTFEEGILPTDRIVDRIWDFVRVQAEGVLTNEEVEKLRRGHERSGEMYRGKLSRPGPFALNLRESALNPQREGNHDYLASTEILDDIVKFVPSTKKEILLRRFKEATVPCIVTFEHSLVTPSYIARAIYYIKGHLENNITSGCNTCFDGHGESVPVQAITNIDFVNYTPQH